MFLSLIQWNQLAGCFFFLLCNWFSLKLKERLLLNHSVTNTCELNLEYIFLLIHQIGNRRLPFICLYSYKKWTLHLLVNILVQCEAYNVYSSIHVVNPSEPYIYLFMLMPCVNPPTLICSCSYRIIRNFSESNFSIFSEPVQLTKLCISNNAYRLNMMKFIIYLSKITKITFH